MSTPELNHKNPFQREEKRMLYQIGITLKKKQTNTHPEKYTLLAQPEFLEAENALEAIALYTLRMSNNLQDASYDNLMVTVNQGQQVQTGSKY